MAMRAPKAPASDDKAPQRRRGHNEGTIIERVNEKTGKVRFQAQVLVNGKRHTETHATKKDAQKWIRDTLAKADEGFLPEKSKVTVGEFLDKWLEMTTPSIRPRTVEQYSDMIRLHLKPTLATIKLAQLRPDHVQTLMADKLATGLSARTVRIGYSVLHHALKDAMKWGLVGRNVTEAVTPPKVQRKEMQVWTPDQARAFLAGVAGDRWESLYLLALSCGLREGELLGLRWEDVNLDAGQLQVRRTIQRLGDGKGKIIGEPKTAKGRRLIYLTRPLVEALRRRHVRQIEERLAAGERWRDTGYVFTSALGSASEQSNLRRDFKAHVKRLGLTAVRFHDLRHTCATTLLSEGVHPKIVQEMLGHSQIAMTLDIYSHVLPSMHEEAARVMERVFAAV